MNRQVSTKIEKTQVPKQAPLKIMQGIPSKTDIANMNPQSMVLDETNGILHVKGNKNTFKFQGVAE